MPQGQQPVAAGEGGCAGAAKRTAEKCNFNENDKGKKLDSVVPKPAGTSFLIGTGLRAEIFVPRGPQRFARVGKRDTNTINLLFGGFVPKFPAPHANLECPPLPTASLLKKEVQKWDFRGSPPARRCSRGTRGRGKWGDAADRLGTLEAFATLSQKDLTKRLPPIWGSPLPAKPGGDLCRDLRPRGLTRPVWLTLGGQRKKFRVFFFLLGRPHRPRVTGTCDPRITRLRCQNPSVIMARLGCYGYGLLYGGGNVCNYACRIAKRELGNAKYSPCRWIPNSRCCLAGRCQYAFGVRV